MPAFTPSGRSLAEIATCHRDLRRLVEELWKDGHAFHVLCGHRDKVAQTRAYEAKKSKLPWPKSRHNTFPSRAMDLAPYPLDWEAVKEFDELAKIVLNKAAMMGIKLVWGGSWKKLVDRPHFELAADHVAVSIKAS